MAHTVENINSKCSIITLHEHITKEDVDNVHDYMEKNNETTNVLMNIVGAEIGREALFEDAKVNSKLALKIKKIAVVDRAGDHKLLKGMLKGYTSLPGKAMKVFEETELEEAKAWIVE